MVDKYGLYFLKNGVIGGIASAADGTGIISLDERIANNLGAHEKILNKLAKKIGSTNCSLTNFGDDAVPPTIVTNLPSNELLGELWDAKLITHDEMIEAHKGLELSIKQMAPAKSSFLGLF